MAAADAIRRDVLVGFLSTGIPPLSTSFQRSDQGYQTNNAVPAQRISHQHWVQTGPGVMIVSPMVREMAGYPGTGPRVGLVSGQFASEPLHCVARPG